jgi:signal transduction histidine kinase
MAASPPASPPTARPVKNPLSLRRVETAIARSAAGFGFAFVLQSIPPFLGQSDNLQPIWSVLVLVGIGLSLVATGVASIIQRHVRAATVSFAVVYLLALISWPFAVIDPAAAPESAFWLYFMMTVATTMASLTLPLTWSLVYLVAVPVIYAIIRITPDGGAVSPLTAVLDSTYSIILGGAIIIIAAVLGNAATAVDRAQQAALDRYANAVRQHAIEAERVQVDAIVHDSVLTTLLSAARAYTTEAKELAATMAGNAIGYLRDAVAIVPDSDTRVGGAVLVSRIIEAAATMSQPIQVRSAGVQALTMPLPVAEALYSATVQAMVNSLQHAGASTPRWVAVQGAEDGAVRVEIADEGVGFVVADVPTERLGVRVSILERVASAGGRAEILSEPGAGTRVVLRWPDAEASGAPVFDEFVAGSGRGGRS